MVEETSLGHACFILKNQSVKFESLFKTSFGSNPYVIFYITLSVFS